MHARKSLLPFAVPSKDYVKTFTKEEEMAAIFCSAEHRRRKGRGLILRKPAEELLFIAEVCYPIWLIPWEGSVLLFDGLGIYTHTLSFDILPDVKTFFSDVEGSAATREAYYASLSDNLNYFQRFIGREKRKIDGLLANPEFVRDFASYLPEAQLIRKPIEKVLLTPAIDEPSVLSYTQELSNIKAGLVEELNELNRCMRLLSTTTRRHAKDIKAEIKQIRKNWQKKITEAKASIAEKLRKTKQRFDEEIVMTSRRFDERLESLHRERLSLGKTVQSMIDKIERCEAEAKFCRLQGDEGGEFRWRKELEESRKELSNLQKTIKEMDEKIRESDSSRKLEISKLRSEYDNQAEDAMKELRVLEASRDAQIRMRQQEMEPLEDATATIIDMISKLVEEKERALAELGELGIEKAQRKPLITYIPLYMICYRTESGRRYLMHPPSWVMSKGIPAELKGLLKGSKVRSLLVGRSKPITSFLNQFTIVVKRNPVFEKNLYDAGMTANILRTKELKERILKGMEELEREGWIPESECKIYADALAKA